MLNHDVNVIIEDEAANSGNKNAQFSLAKLYQHKLNFKKAFYWYQQSSNQKNSIAQYNLAECYKNGWEQITKEFLLVMEYANGGNLQNYLNHNFKDLTWNDKKKLAFQIADGLNYLHNEDVLHRDLHSKNIVIHENNAKITDFGISKVENHTTIFIGTFCKVAYMEPQILANPKFQYIKASDIYSYGVLMWEISSGYPPFRDHNGDFLIANAIINKIREDAVPDTPEDYEKLYKKCWIQEPRQRPTILEIVEVFSKMGFKMSIKDESAEQIVAKNDTDSESQVNNELSECIQIDSFADLSAYRFGFQCFIRIPNYVQQIINVHRDLKVTIDSLRETEKILLRGFKSIDKIEIKFMNIVSK
ncbi:13950_t:CDS:2 [Funneliformis geosporum]|uniref:13950_t:CDS:1 n=1 Tax=Funneliformis geosporum TaxID=1117311 RepID=A0A9W4SB13_9GLOM|nr:13950_t:CDS:2 [Funneliformis geosporum]